LVGDHGGRTAPAALDWPANLKAKRAQAEVEAKLSASPALCLLADLANTEKHVLPTRGPRSGKRPQVADYFGEPSPNRIGWRARLSIKHGQFQVDGLQAAENAVSAWRQLLLSWGLI
jgi:hypothetical protein